MVVYIEFEPKYCNIYIESPVTNKDIEKISKIDFVDFVRASITVDEDDISPPEFINIYLSNSHRVIMKQYIMDGISKIVDDFGMTNDY